MTLIVARLNKSTNGSIIASFDFIDRALDRNISHILTYGCMNNQLHQITNINSVRLPKLSSDRHA